MFFPKQKNNSHLSRMSSKRHDRPGTVGLDVPDPDGLVVGAGNDPSGVELMTIL